MPPQRIITITLDDVEVAKKNTAPVIAKIRNLSALEARNLCGALVLAADRAADRAADADRPQWLDAGWRGYLLALFTEVPHFAFFLRSQGQEFVEIVLALFPRKHLAIDGDGKLAPDGEMLTRVLATVLDPVISYCVKVNQPPLPVIAALLEGFGPVGRPMVEYYKDQSQ